ncbi:MAG: isoprenylcysteine carboxylmethyltransferase family protein [Proteobacteria bacterium]|nr:isoprenylcysteine carboxylmethyltransferase family protein [Pseudomonadota bacterium]
MFAIFAAGYGAAAYALFTATVLYAIGFVANLPLPKTIDGGESGRIVWAVTVNLALLGLFALQHSIMARPGFKRWWTRFVPQPIERATYVLCASLALCLLFWQWVPIPGIVWHVADPSAALALRAVSFFGWALLFVSTFLLSHFELFGLSQIYARLRGRTMPPAEFQTPGLYRLVRHPIYLGFLLAFWATPDMSYGHLLFALATTAYILIGIQLEERDLIALFGEQYRAYRRRVPMLLPFPARRPDATAGSSAAARQQLP